MRDTGRTAASLMAEISLVACRLPFGTILILQAATSQLAAQHLHSPCLPRSPTRTGAAHLVLPPPADLVRTIAPDQTGPRLCFLIATPPFKVLRRPFESSQYVSIHYTERL